MPDTWIHRHQCKVKAEPSRAFAALINPEQLRRWFAEDVLVEARTGGRYAFWGRYTYGVPREPDPEQRISRFIADQLLAYTWTVDGAPSEVQLSLAADEARTGTQLTLEHAFGVAADRDFRNLIDDLWRLTLGNLDAFLRGGEGIVLPDYSDPSPEIRLSILIEAAPERVFRALTEPAALNGWIASAAEVDPRVGGRYSYGWQNKKDGRTVCVGPTQILDIVPNRRLVTDWPDWRGDPDRPKTRVAWLLEPVGTATRVTVVHGEFPRTADISDYPFGWPKFLGRLRNLIEGETT